MLLKIQVKSLIILLIICLLNACSALSSKTLTKHKQYKLTTIVNQLRVGYETKGAILYFGKEDVIDHVNFMIDYITPCIDSMDSSFNKDDLLRIHKELINEESGNGMVLETNEIIFYLRSNLNTIKNIDQNYVVQDWKLSDEHTPIDQAILSVFIDKWLIGRPIFNKKLVEVYNKSSKKRESSIFSCKKKDVDGTYLIYKFEDGVEFYKQTIFDL